MSLKLIFQDWNCTSPVITLNPFTTNRPPLLHKNNLLVRSSPQEGGGGVVPSPRPSTLEGGREEPHFHELHHWDFFNLFYLFLSNLFHSPFGRLGQVRISLLAAFLLVLNETEMFRHKTLHFVAEIKESAKW